MTLSVTPSRYEAPTNPQFYSTSVTDGNRIYTAVVPNGDVSFTVEGFGGSVTEYSNLTNTKGFRIKCYDALTGEGIQFNPSTIDFETYDYFVLVYSDDDYQHHFARIKEIITEDEEGDAFEFEPKLGNEIPKNTKFIIFKGPSKATDVVAISLGILQDSTRAHLRYRMSCSRPLFYFYDGLDKEGELNHNTKYYVMREDGTANSYTLDNTKDVDTFRTVQDFGQTIVDYSKYSLRVTLTDTLRTIDVESGGNITLNEGGTMVADRTDYNQFLPNARRDSDDDITTRVYTGEQRYLHYDYSPLRANFTYGVYTHQTYDSVNGRGGFSETKIVDTSRILQKKITEFTDYKVRHIVHRANIDDWFALEATFSSDAGSHVFTFDTTFDLDGFINVGDELKIDSRIYIVQTIGSFSGFSQTITMRNRSRLETESILTSGYYTPTSEAIVYRRCYNFTDKTLMVDFDLIDNRYSKLSVSFSSLNMTELFATVSAVDAKRKMITLAFDGDSYYDDPLRYALGQFLIHVERFNGEIENISSKKENGQTVFEIKGRDKFNKLISPIVNLNSLFSEDIVYSSNSPYNKLGNIKSSSTYSIALGATTLATGASGSNFDILPAVGDNLFTANGYIGKVTAVSADPIILTFTPAITEANSEAIYVETEKNYVFTKALGSSSLANATTTSLTGSANKGVFFTAGNEISSVDGSEGNSLTGSSSNTHPKAIGYSITHPNSISEDFSFQAKLTDEFGGSADSDFDTVNALIDFEIVSISQKNNVNVIELAPYVPVTLGRKVEYYDYTDEQTFTSHGTISYIGGSPPCLLHLTNSSAYTLKVGEALYVGSSKTFIGKILSIHSFTTSSVIVRIFLDRTIYNYGIGDEIFSSNKVITDLAVINGAHLWGGKILIHPHLNYTSDGLVPFNVENTVGSGDYNSKYGQMYYKPVSSSFGKFNLNLPIVKASNKQITKFYINNSALNYLYQSYQFKPNLSSNIISFGQTDSSYRTLPLDYRGIGSPFGYNIATSLIHQNEYNNLPLRNSGGDGGLIFYNSKFTDIDQSASRLFMYVVGDLLPYSSLRKDSLMSGNKTINNYDLFLLENKKATDSSIEGGNRLLLKDSNFQSISFNTDTDISTLKRFGLMRLTEICFDSLYNQVNPEKPILKKYGTNYSSYITSSSITDLGGIVSISGTSIVFSGTVSLVNGDKICDEYGNFIGTIDSGSGTTYTLQADGYLTNGGLAALNAIKVEAHGYTHQIYGRNEVDSLFELDWGNIHPLKGAVVPEDSALGGDTSDEIYIANGGTVSQTDQEIYLSFALEASSSPISSYSIIGGGNNADLKVILDYCKNQQSHEGLIGVALDRYDIENGGKHPLVEGNTTQVLKDSKANSVGNVELPVLTSDYHFKEYKVPISASTSSPSNTSDDSKSADGAYMVFKPRLWIGTASNATIKSSNDNLNKSTININPSGGYSNGFLQFIDLTGCYLIPEDGTNIDGSAKTGGTQYQRISMTDVIPSDLIYIYSHEVSDSDVHDHHLITDVGLTNNTAYRILQPNEVCFYDFMPKDIYINMLRPSYTKKANRNETYNINKGYFYRDGTDNGNELTLDEGVLSMFVPIDTDNINGESRMVVINTDEFHDNILPEGEHGLYFSDGDNSSKVTLSVKKHDTNNHSVVFSKLLNLNGIVSVSEPFTVTSNSELKINPSRACIGTTATVCLEAEDLINELFEQNGIDFSIPENTDYPLYLAPNFKGVDLYAAIRYIMERKDMVLREENGTFSITQDNDSTHYSNIILNDTDKFKIYEFEKATTLFDFYNDIIVYGNTHKAERKDLRSVQKRGRKTLEHHDKTLLTQDEVDRKAIELLRLHTTFNQKLIMTVSHEGLSQLRAGDIINVEIKQENIELGQYMVLQIEHELTGLMKLELGRYSKQLSDLFSELLVTQKQINSNLRNETFNEKSVTYNFLDTINIKELRLLIRKRQAIGGFTLGFSETLNTGDNPLGFDGGTITITDLYEEDLA